MFELASHASFVAYQLIKLVGDLESCYAYKEQLRRRRREVVDSNNYICELLPGNATGTTYFATMFHKP